MEPVSFFTKLQSYLIARIIYILLFLSKGRLVPTKQRIKEANLQLP